MYIQSKTLIFSLILFGIFLFGNSCKAGLDTETLDVLSQLIDELKSQPGRWEEVLKNNIIQLENSGGNLSEKIASDVRAVSNSMIAQAGNQVSCRSDFVVIRLQQRLQSIGHKYDPERFSKPSIFPVICSTNPDNKIEIGDQIISYYGFDFLEFDKVRPFRAYLQYSDGTEIGQAGIAAPSTNYQLNLDIQSPELQDKIQKLDKNRQPQIVIKWGDESIKQQSILPIIVPKVTTRVPYEMVGTIGKFGGHWGTWGKAEQCPPNQWAVGGELRIEPSIGRGDDTALNGIYLRCGTSEERVRTSEIKSSVGPWGNKYEMGDCDEGYIIAARLRIEPKLGRDDDTGAVNARFWCEDGQVLQTSLNLPWGDWSSRMSCPPKSAICGIRTRLEGSQGDGDDTALNDAEFNCCTLPG